MDFASIIYPDNKPNDYLHLLKKKSRDTEGKTVMRSRYELKQLNSRACNTKTIICELNLHL